MSNLFKYKIALDSDLPKSEMYELNSQSISETESAYAIPYFFFILVFAITTTVLTGIVMILNYCFPNSLDGTYLKLFF